MRFFAAIFATVALADECALSDFDKTDCGFSGIDQSGCEAKGCCWVPVQSSSGNVPWCFFKKGDAPSCPIIGSDKGLAFSDADVATMTGFFSRNLDISGKGGVVAAPDHNTPGGSYYYAWMRDGALSMRALLTTQGLTDDVKTKFAHYIGWVQRRQQDQDPNQIDVRVEPKFELPDGGVFAGGWCRPQTDGPALRAGTLMAYATAASSEKDLWSTISTDLDWVAENWQSESCDLWEEIRSSGLFWNTFNFREAMTKGSAMAWKVGDSDRKAKYAAAAAAITGTLKNFEYSGGLMESQNRQADSAVINALNVAYLDDGVYSPLSLAGAKTVSNLSKVFCNMFQVNQDEAKAGNPGMFFGRYQGDQYAGGNPWIIATAVLGEYMYRAAAALQNGGNFEAGAEDIWKATLDKFDTTNPAASFKRAGDGILARIEKFARPDGLHLAEQMDRNTGAQLSAKDLTWSYATVLRAVHARSTLQGEDTVLVV